MLTCVVKGFIYGFYRSSPVQQPCGYRAMWLFWNEMPVSESRVDTEAQLEEQNVWYKINKIVSIRFCVGYVLEICFAYTGLDYVDQN